ncbi:MAG: hypothetical protein N2202_09915 [Proteobacteria bacterium]|nr:hypothetical protein [Pseudomonadota bacterium]
MRIFCSWAGTNRVYVYESTGEGANRSFRTGDEFGCVVYHAIDWESEYVPYSPFPQFIEIIPSPGTYPLSQNPFITISVKCKGSGDVDIYNIGIDNQSVAFTKVKKRGLVTATSNLNFVLSEGRHKVQVIAVNSIAGQVFWDEYCWEFDLL